MSAQTYLTLINDFCAKHGLPILGAVVGATEATARQLLALTHEVTEDLQQYAWENQNIYKTWNGLIAEDQGALTTIFGAGFRSLKQKTFWNTTTRQPIQGPVTEQQWVSLKAIQVGGSLYNYRIAQGHLFIYPALTAANGLSAVYASKFGVLDASSVLIDRVTADACTFIYPDNVFKSSLEWRWLKQKGEAWLAAKDEALRAILMNVNADNSLPELNLSGTETQIVPGIWVPAGSIPL